MVAGRRGQGGAMGKAAWGACGWRKRHMLTAATASHHGGQGQADQQLGYEDNARKRCKAFEEHWSAEGVQGAMHRQGIPHPPGWRVGKGWRQQHGRHAAGTAVAWSWGRSGSLVGAAAHTAGRWRRHVLGIHVARAPHAPVGHPRRVLLSKAPPRPVTLPPPRPPARHLPASCCGTAPTTCPSAWCWGTRWVVAPPAGDRAGSRGLGDPVVGAGEDGRAPRGRARAAGRNTVATDG